MTLVFHHLKKEILCYGLLTLLLALVMVSDAYVMQFILDAIHLGEAQYALRALGIIFFLIVQTLLYYFQQLLTAVLSKKSAYVCRKELFKTIQKLPLNALTGDKHDKLLSSLTAQIDQVDYHYFYSLYWGGYLICQLIIAIIISLYFNPLMSALTLILSLPNVLVAIAFKNTLEGKQEKLTSQTDTTIASIQDIIEGIQDWKTAQQDQAILSLFEQKTAKLLQQQIATERSQQLVASLNQLFSNTLYFGSWILGGWLIMQGRFTLGSLVAFSQLLVMISYPVYASSDLLAKYISGKKVLRLLSQEFILERPAKNSETSIDRITLEDFSITNANNRQPLQLTFHKNNKYLLKGKSGIGKTSILKAILGEYQDYQGVVKINDSDIKTIKETNLFDHIGYVPQQPHIFHATLRDNLTLFSKQYTDETLNEVLAFVELAKWANPDALDMFLSNDTRNISGGEAKRVSLARALLLQKDILLLDEFSSGIDYETLLNVENKLLQLDKTLIYVTHVDSKREGKPFDAIIDLNQYFSLD